MKPQNPVFQTNVREINKVKMLCFTLWRRVLEKVVCFRLEEGMWRHKYSPVLLPHWAEDHCHVFEQIRISKHMGWDSIREIIKHFLTIISRVWICPPPTQVKDTWVEKRHFTNKHILRRVCLRCIPAKNPWTMALVHRLCADLQKMV